jgi:hypothetical protein
MREKTVKVGEIEVPAAKLLMELYNRSAPQGLGFLHAQAGNLSLFEAEAALEGRQKFHFDYLHGRPIKIKPREDNVIDDHDIFLYERDNGEGAFEAAMTEALR